MNVEAARRQMVEQQIRTWEVLDERVLETILSVPREAFVPPAWRGLAFADTAIPLGHGEVMMMPKVEGRLLQSLGLRDSDAVLEVGTGSGFLAACLGRLAKAVTSLEIRAEFAERAMGNLRAAGIDNVTVETRDAMELKPEPRFDAIAVTGSLPVYDERFERALALGGRLFVITGSPPVMEAQLVTRAGDREWIAESLFETAIPPLRNAAAPSGFVF